MCICSICEDWVFTVAIRNEHSLEKFKWRQELKLPFYMSLNYKKGTPHVLTVK